MTLRVNKSSLKQEGEITKDKMDSVYNCVSNMINDIEAQVNRGQSKDKANYFLNKLKPLIAKLEKIDDRESEQFGKTGGATNGN